MKFELVNLSTNEVQYISAKDIFQAKKIQEKLFSDNYLLVKMVSETWQCTTCEWWKQWFGIY